MKKAILLVFLVSSFISLSGQLRNALRDENGRHVIGHGFVVITNNTYFDSDDYLRMARLGANYQVVRLEYGRLSGFPETGFDPNYLLKLDTLVQLGKDVGIKTIFKMKGHSKNRISWERFYYNEENSNETFIDAWKGVWNKFKDESSVIGYV